MQTTFSDQDQDFIFVLEAPRDQDRSGGLHHRCVMCDAWCVALGMIALTCVIQMSTCWKSLHMSGLRELC